MAALAGLEKARQGPGHRFAKNEQQLNGGGVREELVHDPRHAAVGDVGRTNVYGALIVAAIHRLTAHCLRAAVGGVPGRRPALAEVPQVMLFYLIPANVGVGVKLRDLLIIKKMFLLLPARVDASHVVEEVVERGRARLLYAQAWIGEAEVVWSMEHGQARHMEVQEH